MRNLKVAVRLSIGFGLVMALMVAGLVVAFLGLRGAAGQADRMARENIALLNTADSMQMNQLVQAIAIRDFVSLPDVESQRHAQQALKGAAKGYAAAAAELERIVAGSERHGELKSLADKVTAANARVEAKMREAMDLSDAAEYQQAQALVYRDLRPLQMAISTDLQALVASSNALARERAAAVQVQAREVEMQLLAAALLALVVGTMAVFRITRDVADPLRSAVAMAERVADGDLSGTSIASHRDEPGRVLTALGAMQGRLNELVRSIRGSAEGVSGVSEQISTANTDLAARTEEQASSLEETAASVEELTAIVKQNSEGAGKASELARRAAGMAEEGGQAVAGVVQTMDGIQKSSRKVSEIIGVMDEIAFQTNLLALNAAVEAARAGDQGRGFAVVATQVRVLAQRSAEASKDIKQLVGTAVGEADKGGKAAARAGESMDGVVRVAREVARLVSDIAQASEEQRAGIEQVNATIAQMDGVTQSNAGLVQEISGLAEQLLGQSRELVAAASRFKLERSAGDDAALPSFAPAGPPEMPGGWQSLPQPAG